MKRLALCAALITVAAAFGGCVEETEGKSRLDAFGMPVKPRAKGIVNGSGAEKADTLVFISGVDFPSEYDWRRDTSYGRINGKIVLYKNGELMLSIPAGGESCASLDPDRHHLVDGHIYTEYFTGSETVLGCDGKEILSWEGQEILRGMLVEGNTILSLGQSRNGTGLTLRRNGEVIYSNTEGTVTGHMADNPDYPGGALYKDGGHLYFCFTKNGTSGREWYVVEDGKQVTRIQVTSDKTADIRMKNGKPVTYDKPGSRNSVIKYSNGTNIAYIIYYANMNLFLNAPLAVFSVQTTEKYYFFSCSNAFLLGNHFYVVTTPAEKGAAPFLWKDGAVTELEMNGFVTGVYVSVVPG